MTVDNRSFIAIDYGTRRIGIAKSDPMGLIASSLKTITVTSMKDAISQLQDVIAEFEPDGLIVGYPLLSSGDKSKKCIEIDEFVELLGEHYDGPIHKVDEQYSSQEAVGIIRAHKKKSGSRKEAIDRLAAVIILQRFLDDES